MKKKETEGLLRIGELARASGVNVSTIKYYISQGFLQPTLKTSANMSYYAPSEIERIRLIKQLQQEKHYPLSLIGELLNGEQDPTELDLWSAIHKISPSHRAETVPYPRAAAESGLTAPQVDALVAQDVVSTCTVRGKPAFDDRNMGILHLVKRRCDAGLPFEQTLESFSIYQRALDEAVQQDVDAMIRHVIIPGRLPSATVAALIRTADATLDEFVPLKRDTLDTLYSTRRMMEVRGHLAGLGRLAAWLPALAGGGAQSQTAAGHVRQLSLLKSEIEIATSGALLSKAYLFFKKMAPEQEPDAAHQTGLLALRLGFFSLAPAFFDWTGEAEAYERDFVPDCAAFIGQAAAKDYYKEVKTKLKELRDTDKER